jgi:hypothetical protein
MTTTIDTIATQVFTNLAETREGQRRVGGTDQLVTALNAAAAALREKRAQLRPRPGMSFSVNTTQAQRDPLTISVRVHGVDCGFVAFEKTGRMFEPSPNFFKQWSSAKTTYDQRALDWGKPGVATFIKACGDEADSRKYGRRESSIQESLFRAMKGGGSRGTPPGADTILVRPRAKSRQLPRNQISRVGRTLYTFASDDRGVNGSLYVA